MIETYVLSWSRMFRVGTDDLGDIPDYPGIFRVWSVLGQCLYVGNGTSVRTGLIRFLGNLEESGAALMVPGGYKLYADWARVPDQPRLRRLHIAESKRLRPRWGWPQ